MEKVQQSSFITSNGDMIGTSFAARDQCIASLTIETNKPLVTLNYGSSFGSSSDIIDRINHNGIRVKGRAINKFYLIIKVSGSCAKRHRRQGSITHKGPIWVTKEVLLASILDDMS